jgi:large subunit ribosomal protein L7/L12
MQGNINWKKEDSMSEEVEQKEEEKAAEETQPKAEKAEAKTEKTEAKTEKAAAKAPKVAAKSGATMSKDDLIAAIKNMTVLELSELVKALEEEFGVSAAAPVAMAAAAGPAGAAEAAPAEEEEEKTEFNVTLKDIGANKIQVIKTVREVTGLGLKESKELVEAAPTSLKEGVNKEELATIKEKMEGAGATIEVA